MHFFNLQQLLYHYKVLSYHKTKETNALLQHNNLSLQTVEKYKRKISSLQKIPSKIEVAPPLYAAYTVDTVITVYTIQTALHLLRSSMYANKYC